MAAAADDDPLSYDYSTDTEKLVSFLQDFQEDDIDGSPVHKYMVILQQVANRRERKVHVDLDDVYESLGDEIGEHMRKNTKRYQKLLAMAIDKVLPEPTVDILEEDVADMKLSSNPDGSSARLNGAEESNITEEGEK